MEVATEAGGSLLYTHLDRHTRNVLHDPVLVKIRAGHGTGMRAIFWTLRHHHQEM
jgi:hypothetical protein